MSKDNKDKEPEDKWSTAVYMDNMPTFNYRTSQGIFNEKKPEEIKFKFEHLDLEDLPKKND